MTKAGIYVHIPFCKFKCIYCDYYSLEKREEEIPQFLEMLIQEIQLTALDYHEHWVFDTIFFGGGSPSLMEPKWLEKIINSLHQSFDISKVKEITLEANPGEASRKQLTEFRKLGINRLSIGFQSLQSNLLTFLSRIHSPKDCLTTYNNARDADFDNINVDMLYNIPGQSQQNWQADLELIIKLAPEHISTYSLTVEQNTPLHKMILNGQVAVPHKEMDQSMFEFSNKYLTTHGYNQYEITSYSQEGMECYHNLHNWRLEPYLAFGPSAHRYDGHVREWNLSSLDTYMQKLKQNEKPLSGSETLSLTDHINEAIIYGLRTREGIQLRKLKSWGADSEKMKPIITKWENHLIITKDFIRLKADDLMYADKIASDLILAQS